MHSNTKVSCDQSTQELPSEEQEDDANELKEEEEGDEEREEEAVDDEDDDGLIPYDLDEEEDEIELKVPLYLRDCLPALRLVRYS